MDVVVIGAGLSGLAAAHRLIDAGHQVTVLESSTLPGGRCRHIERDGFLIDTGPDLASQSYHRYFSLANKVGLGSDIIPTSTIAGFVRNGKPIEVDSAKPLNAAFTPLLSWSAKIKTLLGMLKHRHLIKQAHSYKLVDMAQHEDSAISAGEFARRNFGNETADYVIDAIMRPLGGSHMDTLSSLLVIGALSSWTEPLLTIRGGLYRVPEMAAKQLNVIYNASVEQVIDVDDGVEITYRDDGRTVILPADSCVVATQYHDAERLYPTFKKLAGDYGDKLRYCRLMDIKLAFSVKTISKAYAVFVPTVENKELLMYSLTHNKATDRVPSGHSLFTLYTDDAVWERFNRMSDEEIIDWGRSEMEKLYPELSGQFLFGHIEREAQTANYADCSFHARTEKLLTALNSSAKVQLAGDVFAGGSMEAAVIWGERAADRLMKLAAK